MTIKTCKTVQIPPPEGGGGSGGDTPPEDDTGSGEDEPSDEPEIPEDSGGGISRKAIAVGGAAGLGLIGYMRKKDD